MVLVNKHHFIRSVKRGGSLETTLEVLLPAVGRQFLKGITKKRLIKILGLLNAGLIKPHLFPFLIKKGQKVLEKGYDKATDFIKDKVLNQSMKPEAQTIVEGKGIKPLLTSTSKMLLDDILQKSKRGKGLEIY